MCLQKGLSRGHMLVDLLRTRHTLLFDCLHVTLRFFLSAIRVDRIGCDSVEVVSRTDLIDADELARKCLLQLVCVQRCLADGGVTMLARQMVPDDRPLVLSLPFLLIRLAYLWVWTLRHVLSEVEGHPLQILESVPTCQVDHSQTLVHLACHCVDLCRFHACWQHHPILQHHNVLARPAVHTASQRLIELLHYTAHA